MFLGHFGLAMAAKRIDSKVSLGTTFLAAQLIDLLWPFFLIAGLERVEIDPGNTAVTPLDFVHYPYSHSLAAVIIWAFVFGIIYYLLKKRWSGSVLLFVLVVSHWLLDLLTHRPDLPIAFGDTSKYGLGLWNNVTATIITELILFSIGCAVYLRSTQQITIWGTISFVSLAVFLLIVYFMNVFGNPPPSAEIIGYAGLAQWLFVAWGYWIDASRREYGSAPNPKKGLE